VYVLGAGFSAEGGVPLVKDFLSRMADSVEWLYQHGREAEAEAIRRVFEFRLRASAAAYRTHIDVDNIEELFSLASASEGETLSDDVTIAIAATIDATRETAPACECTVEYKSWSDNGTSWAKKEQKRNLYDLYASIMGTSNLDPRQERNTIITFNYDTLLEQGLCEAHIPFHYGLPEQLTDYDKRSHNCLVNESPGSLPVLKLHGSVNWSKPTSRAAHMTVYGSYADQRSTSKGPLLVPPTWRKVFADQLSTVWENAVNALEKATRITVIGFSMRPTDAHFKYLLAAGLQNNISLRKFVFVNPGLADQEEETMLRRNLFSVIREEFEKKGIVQLEKLKTHEFLLSSPHLQIINRRHPDDYIRVTFDSAEHIQTIPVCNK
jgi:hypothetical protein